MSQTQVERLFIKDRTSLMHDLFRLTTTVSSTSAASPTAITANLERADDALAGHLGTGMSESSGVFTFPSTGIYKITANGQFLRNNAEILYAGLYIFSTSDNFSSEDYLASSFCHTNNTANSYSNVVTHAVYDVTDLTNNKVKFKYQSNPGFYMTADTGANATFFLFQKLGDT